MVLYSWRSVRHPPTTTFPTGGRYCSTMMVDRGNAPVFERITVNITTAVMGGTPGDQSLSPLTMNRQGSAEVCSTIYPGCFPGLTLRGFPNALERIQGQSTRRTMYSIPSNLHSLIVLPFYLLQCHPSRWGTDQRASSPRKLKSDSVGRDLTLLRMRRESPRKGSLVVETWSSL